MNEQPQDDREIQSEPPPLLVTGWLTSVWPRLGPLFGAFVKENGDSLLLLRFDQAQIGASLGEWIVPFRFVPKAVLRASVTWPSDWIADDISEAIDVMLGDRDSAIKTPVFAVLQSGGQAGFFWCPAEEQTAEALHVAQVIAGHSMASLPFLGVG